MMHLTSTELTIQIENAVKLCFEKRETPVIAGPTASGKTELAYLLAQKFDIEIISADSRQIYKYLDIGTAKPDKKILDALPHHLISIIAPDKRYSAAEFAVAADKLITDIFQKNKLPVIVGGTGFYINALFNGLFNGPESDETIRAELEKFSNEQLFESLKKYDNLSAEKLHINDRKRIIRALEVFKITGKTISEFHSLAAVPLTKFKPYYIIFNTPREILYNRINARADKMLDNGWIEETKAILENGYSADCPAFEGLGYREIISFLNNKISFNELSETIKMMTRRYAKRQIIWFRHQIKQIQTPDLKQKKIKNKIDN